MQLISKAAVAGALTVGALAPVAASAHVVSQADPRGDANGPFDLRATSMEETSGLELKVEVKEFNRIPGRPPGMPCVAFDYISGPAADRVACAAASGKRYELRSARSGKLVTSLRYSRPDGKAVRIIVPAKFVSGPRAIRWRAYIEGSRDTIADTTRWRTHRFAD